MTATQFDRVRVASSVERLTPGERVLPIGLLALSASGVVLGFVLLAKNSADALAVPYLAVLLLALVAVLAYDRQRTGAFPRDLVTIGALSAASILVLLALPEYLYGHQLNGIVHRSFFSSLVLLGIGAFATSASLSRSLGGTPSATVNARYAFILLPIAVVLLAYGLVLVELINKGTDGLTWHVITTPYAEHLQGAAFQHQAGLRNHIIGTFTLVGMTTAIALLPGVAAGVFMNEYPGRMAHVIRFSTTMLRAVSPFIIGVAAFGLIQSVSSRSAGDPISEFIRGYYSDANGFKFASKGSFITASVFLSLLVMPVIARATEEGLRSVPNEIREGSVALGVTDGHGLLHILLPWATPNIVTAVLLGAAEAAGSVAVLLLIAGTGQNGVGPLKEATSLSFVIFETRYGPKPFQDSMAQYQFTAALLLIALTLTLTVSALLIKWRLSKRYRGSLTD